MLLFVGLGNPGAKYAGNRHNVGFMAVETIAKRHGLPPWRRRFQGVATEGPIGGVRVQLLLPGTFMNESGRAVSEAMHFYKTPLSDIVVFHDELDLPPSKVRVKVGGGIAGHNGLRSITEHIGNDYRRVRSGIVGMPNVGKSTLFNALTQTAAAQAANYPFCTIEPNVGEVAVPDPRLDTLAKLGKSEQIIPTRLSFVDIAGLVRGASKGEGLGNQFLANIRDVDAIAHVVRCFKDDDVTHVQGRIEPVADIETIETELMLADLESLEKRVDNLEKKAKGSGEEAKEAKEALSLIQRVLDLLRDGKPARLV